jgi:hypothetical protein
MAISKIGAKSMPRKLKKTMAKASSKPVKYSAPVIGHVPPRKPKRKISFMAVVEGVKATLRRVIHIGSYGALYPTAILNMAGSPSAVIAICNVGFVVGAAAFIDYGTVLMRQGDKLGKRVFALGLLFVAVNIVNAGSNMAHIAGMVRDQAQGAMNRAGLLKDQLVDIKRDIATNEERRAKQTDIAGEKPVDAIEHDIGALTTSNARNWNDSKQCTAINPKSGAQKSLCGDVQRLEGVKAAAQERDRLTAERATLDKRKAGIEAKLAASGDTPSSVDSFGDSLKSVAPVFGLDLSDARKNAMTPLKGWFWAGSLEVLSAFAPLVLGGLLAHLLGLGEEKPASAEPQPQEERVSRLSRWYARRAEEAQDSFAEEDETVLIAAEPEKTVLLAPPQTVLGDTVTAFRDAKL